MLCKIFISFCLLVFCLPALALKDDTAQPLSINSSIQSVNMQTNVITFTGGVNIVQGSIQVSADKVIVTRQNNQQGNELIEAFGNPVQFSQKQDNGKVINGSGKKLTYELQTEKVTLEGNAMLIQEDSSIKSPLITYLVKQQRMEATATSHGSKVLTILQPSQLRNTQTNN